MSQNVSRVATWVASMAIMAALFAPPGWAATDEPPRVIARFDVGLLGSASGGGKGGGISVPIGGTGAGLEDSGGPVAYAAPS